MTRSIEVRRLHIAAPSRDGTVTASSAIEDALRTSSLGPIVARGVLVVRQLRTGPVARFENKAIMARRVQSGLVDALQAAVRPDNPAVNSAKAVLFKDDLEPCRLFARLLCRGRNTDSWFWFPIFGGRLPRPFPAGIVDCVHHVIDREGGGLAAVEIFKQVAREGALASVVRHISRNEASGILARGFGFTAPDRAVEYRVSRSPPRPAPARAAPEEAESEAIFAEGAGILGPDLLRAVAPFARDDPRTLLVAACEIATLTRLMPPQRQVLVLASRIAASASAYAYGHSIDPREERPRHDRGTPPPNRAPPKSQSRVSRSRKAVEAGDWPEAPPIPSPRPASSRRAVSDRATSESSADIRRRVADQAAPPAGIRRQGIGAGAPTDRLVIDGGPGERPAPDKMPVGAEPLEPGSYEASVDEAFLRDASWQFQPSCYAGLPLLIVVLDRIGLGSLVGRATVLGDCCLPQRLLRAIAQRYGAGDDDPVLSFLPVPNLTAVPHEPFAFHLDPQCWDMIAPPSYRLIRSLALPGWRFLCCHRGKRIFATWTGPAPREVRDRLSGHRVRRRSVPLKPDPFAALVWTLQLAATRYLRRNARLGLRAAVGRSGRIAVTATHVDVLFGAGCVDFGIRRAGLDINPGWIPWLSRVISFHYDYGDGRV